MSVSLAEVIDPNQLITPRRVKLLTRTLEQEQKRPGVKKPFIQAKVYPHLAGVPRLAWERLYHGPEEDGSTGLAFDGAGNLYRGRSIGTGAAVSRQRVPNPGPGSDFSSWTSAFSASDGKFALCALGGEICYFFFNTADYKYLYQHRSTNYGSSWTSARLSTHTPKYAVNYLSADFKPNGDIGLFNANYHPSVTGQAIVYAIKRIAGVWQAHQQIITFSIGDTHTGIAVKYDGDWNLLITIKRGDFYYLYKAIHGDGFRLPAGQTSIPEVVLSIPATQGYEWHHPFLITLPGDKRPGQLFSFAEKYTGQEPISRPYLCHGLADHDFYDTLFREPIPFNFTTEHGLALARQADYVWAATPSGVWRAPVPSEARDLSRDIINLQEVIATPSIARGWQSPRGSLTIELNNAKGKYNAPGTGALTALNRGSEVRLSLGLKFTGGSEAVPGDHYWIESLEHRVSPNERTFVITAENAWGLLRRWTPRHTLRWTTVPVIRILREVLAKVGIPLDIISCSPAILGFVPDFTISPGDNGLSAVQRLLSFVPDVLTFCRGTAYLINPTPDDIPVYEYGPGKHPILEASYAEDSPEVTRVQVIGRTGTTDIIVDSFNWEELNLIGDRLEFEPDLNVATIPQARDRASAILKEQAKDRGRILTSPNFALQLFDPVQVTDLIAPISRATYRVISSELIYNPQYQQFYTAIILSGV